MSTVTRYYLLQITSRLQSMGLTEAQIASAAPILLTSMSDPMESVSDEHLFRALDMGEEALNVQDIGLQIGKLFNLSTLNHVGKILTMCATLGDAARVTSRYHLLTQSFGFTTIRTHGDVTHMDWTLLSEDVERYSRIVEGIFTGFVIGADWLVYNQAKIFTRIQFRHQPKVDPARYEAVMKCPVIFGAPVDRFELPTAHMDLPIASHNPELLEAMTQYLDEMLVQKQQDAQFLKVVQTSIRQQLRQGKPTLIESARTLDMSDRTLRYRLSMHETRFNDQVSEVRREICVKELRQGTRLADIAQKLAFYDQSAFNHAFKSWFGTTPRLYKRKLMM